MTEKQKCYQSAEYKTPWARKNPEKVKASAKRTYQKYKKEKGDYQRYYRKNMKPERRKSYLKMRIRNQNTRRQKCMDYVNKYKNEHPCVICGEANSVCLDFHHKDPNTKLAPVAKLVANARPINLIDTEIAKCIILCANCHRKLHAGEVSV